MTKSIVQSHTFKASPRELFAMFTNSKKHSAATGAKASVSARPGSKWTAFDGMILGRTLIGLPPVMIVQTWRAAHWKQSDPDSILILRFSHARKGGKVDLVHMGVPQHDRKGVKEGWAKYYWKPWEAYLKKLAAKRPGAR